MSEKRSPKRDEPEKKPKPANTAPDAVKDPNEKIEGKPGLAHQGQGKDSDPGSG